MSEAPAAPLSVRGVAVSLGGRRVLGGVTLSLAAGAIHGLVGPNGAGKTTLLKVLCGLQRADAGEVWLLGEVLSGGEGLAWRARRGLGYLPQGPSVFRELSVRENLRAVPGSDAAGCEAMLRRLSLEDRARARAGLLSGGERRRLELGRLLLMGARVLLCDEPFAALDPVGVEAVGALLREAAFVGCAVLVTDHRIEALLPRCDRVSVLLDGAVYRTGTPEEIRVDPVVQARYLGGSGGA